MPNQNKKQYKLNYHIGLIGGGEQLKRIGGDDAQLKPMQSMCIFGAAASTSSSSNQ